MSIGIYDTATLLGVIRTLPPLRTYWLDLCFPSEMTFDTEKVFFDKITGGRQVAPFVSPNVQGRVMKNKGYSTDSFEPAYIKPKHVVDPSKAIKRRAGEPLMGSMSPMARYQAAVVDNMLIERDMIVRRWELMAAEVIRTGKCTVAGEDFPAVTVDFGRDAGQTITKAAGSKWSDAGVSILDDLNTWISQTQDISGFAPTRLTMSPDVWKVFIKSEEIKGLLETRRGSTSMVETGPGSSEGAQFKGILGASLEVWTYQDHYEDNSGATQNTMPAGTVILSSSGVEGVRAFGAIKDKGAQFQALPIFPKMWDQEDPSVTFTMSQSAPLMVPTRANAILSAKVL